MTRLTRCLSCQGFLSPDQQDADGYHCSNCGDEWWNAELQGNGWTYDEATGMYVYGDEHD